MLKASEGGHTQIVRQLLDAGAHVNGADKDGDAPLIVAALKGHVDCFKALLEAGADLNQFGLRAFVYANEYGHTQIVRELLQAIAAGALVHIATPCDMTFLIIAAGFGHLDCVKALLEAGADTNFKNCNISCSCPGAYTDRPRTIDC